MSGGRERDRWTGGQTDAWVSTEKRGWARKPLSPILNSLDSSQGDAQEELPECYCQERSPFILQVHFQIDSSSPAREADRI